jgi:hypothetical protein
VIGVSAALTTMHSKHAQIAPAFERVLGWEILVAKVDTDQFGSFDGVTPRTLSPKQAAIAKARAGAEERGTRFGLASEGTIGRHPDLPFINSDFELLALVDLAEGHELVVSHLSADIVAAREELGDEVDITALAKKFDLPNHAVNLKIESGSGLQIVKGLANPVELEREIESVRALAGPVKLTLESDFRAMSSPSRQRNIREVAEKLAKRIASTCPGCGYLGWGLARYEFGLSCRECGFENSHLARAGVNTCLRCDLEETFDLGRPAAEPANCLSCNP